MSSELRTGKKTATRKRVQEQSDEQHLGWEISPSALGFISSFGMMVYSADVEPQGFCA
jgi:hypothetical protein